MRLIRLDKALADGGFGSRQDVKALIRRGAVALGGETVKRPETKVDPSKDDITVEGKPFCQAPGYVYYLLNKPAGILSATRDARQRTVLELVPADRRRKLFPVGRLDKDTEGLLLITDNGPLAHALCSPARHVEKEYYVRLDGPLDGEDVLAMARGLEIGEKHPTRPALLEILRSGQSESEAHLTIREGKFHQVKRMFEARGRTVTYLQRVRMGDLVLPKDLEKGAFKELSQEEILRLFGDPG